MEVLKNNPVYIQLSSYFRKLNTSIRCPPRSRGNLIGHGDKMDDPRIVIRGTERSVCVCVGGGGQNRRLGQGVRGLLMASRSVFI